MIRLSNGRPGRLRGGRVALLFGVALALCSQPSRAAPDDPPAEFVWQDLKEIHARMLKPENWFFRRVATGDGWGFQFSPQPFEGEGEIGKGLMMEVIPKVKAKMEKSADEFAAGTLAELGSRGKVLKGWTRKGEPSAPFTTYCLVCVIAEEPGGRPSVLEIVCIANRDTDTLYGFMLTSPRGEWKEVEEWGQTMLANLRLDPKF